MTEWNTATIKRELRMLGYENVNVNYIKNHSKATINIMAKTKDEIHELEEKINDMYGNLVNELDVYVYYF